MQNNIYKECLVRNIPISHHYSDLYIPCTQETIELCKQFNVKFSQFTSNLDKQLWIDVPFQYMPFWDCCIIDNRNLVPNISQRE